VIGLCNQPEAKRVIRQSDIGEVTCSVFLKPEGENYVGQTPTAGCPTNVRGAVRITNTILLHQAGMDTQDRALMQLAIWYGVRKSDLISFVGLANSYSASGIANPYGRFEVGVKSDLL
jgi:hypothetical protein